MSLVYKIAFTGRSLIEKHQVYKIAFTDKSLDTDIRATKVTQVVLVNHYYNFYNYSNLRCL